MTKETLSVLRELLADLDKRVKEVKSLESVARGDNATFFTGTRNGLYDAQILINEKLKTNHD